MTPMTRIPLSPAHATFHESEHDYGDIFVQGGTKGLVLVRSGGHYQTAFIECAPPGSFIRGEGETLAEADDDCWAKLQAYLSCTEHVWESRGYKNGGGFCIKCNQFGSKVFTPEQLGLFCTTCGIPTFHQLTGDKGREPRCKEHDARWIYVLASIRAMFASNDDEGEGMYQRLNAVARGTADDDPEALEWARKNLDLSDDDH